MLRQQIKSMFDDLALTAIEDQIEQLEAYAQYLEEKNRSLNLTRIVGADIVPLHFYDSLSPLKFFSPLPKARLLDLGTGAGLPGIPLKIARPDLSLSLLDSTEKRLNFLRNVKYKLKMNHVTFIHKRAQDAGFEKEYNEQFDIVTARAVAPMQELAQLALPFIKKGGLMIAYKGVNVDNELAATSSIKSLGGDSPVIFPIKVMNRELTHKLVFIRKK